MSVVTLSLCARSEAWCSLQAEMAGLAEPSPWPSTVPADLAGCHQSEQNSGISSHLSHFMKEITFLEAFQILALCRRKIYLKHIGKTPEDGTELVNIDETEEMGLLCRGLSPNISLLQSATCTWGSPALSQLPYTQNQSRRCPGTGELPDWPWPAGIHYRGRVTERADPPSLAGDNNVSKCHSLQQAAALLLGFQGRPADSELQARLMLATAQGVLGLQKSPFCQQNTVALRGIRSIQGS